MPAHDLSGPIKAAVIEKLKANPSVAAIVGARVYDYVSAKPVFPFLRCVLALVQPWEATGGVAGSLILVQVDAFTKEYGTAECDRLNAAAVDALNEADLTLSTGYSIDLTWTRTQTFGDPNEQGVNHGVIEFESLAAA
jgi:hypothetical protein